MQPQRYVLWAALAAGLVAVGFGLAGMVRVAGGAALVLLILFFLLPFMEERS